MLHYFSMNASIFTIRVSRRALGFFILSSALLLWFIIDVLWLHRVFSGLTITLTPLLTVAIVIFFVLIPLLIIITQSVYLLHPPVMFSINEDHLTIATNFRYVPMTIPTRFVKSVSIGLAFPTLSNLGPFDWLALGGVKIHLEPDPSIPSSATTSAGVRYGNYTILISRLYANTSLKKSLKEIQSFLPSSESR